MIKITCNRCGDETKEQAAALIGEEWVDLCDKCGMGLKSLEEMCEVNRQLARNRWLKEGK